MTNLKKCCNKHGYASAFALALFTIDKLWKQPRCPTTDEWIKKMWYLYTMEFYSTAKKNEILSFSGKWMELENFILSKVIKAQKVKKLHVFPHMLIIHLKQMQQYYGTQVTLKERPCTVGVGQGKESKTWMWLMCSQYRNEYRNLKLAWPTMGRGLGRSEEDW
jgi:hypothetical protein